MDFFSYEYKGKPIWSGHHVAYPNKASLFASLLQRHGWCFRPIPLVDCGEYYQAIDGTHRLCAAKRIDFPIEAVIVDGVINPLQKTPEGFTKEKMAEFPFGKVAQLYMSSENHICLLLDEKCKILFDPLAKFLFELLLNLSSQVPLFRKVNDG